jgi:hypothetical protein
MKTLSKILIALMLPGLFLLLSPQQTRAQGAGVSFQVFYDELSPYGEWVEYPGYHYVWIPDAGPDFSPYATEGHWVYTDYGWTWISDYSWGWAPFHYGRWFYDDYYGWMWVPGRHWGPAWVQWRRCEGFYGWAPIGPGVNVESSFGPGYYIRRDYWVFVHDRDFDRPDINRYYINRRDNDRFFDHSTVISNRSYDDHNHVYYVAGPERREVQKYTGREVRAYPVKENSNPGQSIRNNELLIYKPVVEKTKGNGPAPIPQKAVPIKDAKSWTQRTSQNPTQVQNQNNTGKAQPVQQNTGEPVHRQEQGTAPKPIHSNDNNAGKAQPVQHKEATPPKTHDQGQHAQPVTPQNQNTGKAQPAPQHSGNPSVTPKKESHPQGAAPVNPKKAEPEKKTENPTKRNKA